MQISTASDTNSLPNRGTSLLLCVTILTISFLYLKKVGWHGSREIHSILEVAAVLLTFIVGVVASYQHLTSGKNKVLLVIGIGFLATAWFDSMHIAAKAGFFDAVSPPEIARLVAPWTGYTSRLFLSVLFGLCGLVWASSSSGRISPLWGRYEVVFLAAFLSAGMSLIVIAQLSVLQIQFGKPPLARPEELIPGVVFVVVLVGHLNLRYWRWNALAYWLILALITHIFGQMVLLSDTGNSLNSNFDFLYIARLPSHVCVLLGLLSMKYAGVQHAYSATEYRGQTDESIEQNKILYRTLVNSVTDALITVDKRGSIEAINPVAEKLFGHPESYIVGKSITHIVNEASGEPNESDDESANFGAPGNSIFPGEKELFGLRRNGSRFALTLSATEIQIGAERLFCYLIKDNSLSNIKEGDTGLDENACESLGLLIKNLLVAGSSDQIVNQTLDFLVSFEFLTSDEKAAIYLTDSDENKLRLAGTRNLPEDLLKPGSELSADQCVQGMDDSGNSRLSWEPLEKQDCSENDALKTGYCIPINSDDAVVGIIILFSDDNNAEKAGDIALLKTVSVIMSGALQRISVEKKLRLHSDELKKSLHREKKVPEVCDKPRTSLSIIEYQPPNTKPSGNELLEKTDSQTHQLIRAVRDTAQRMGQTKLDDEQKEYLNSLDASVGSLLVIVDDLLELSKTQLDVTRIQQAQKPKFIANSNALTENVFPETNFLQTVISEVNLSTEDDTAEVKDAETIDPGRLDSLKENVGNGFDDLVFNYIKTTRTLLEYIPLAYKQQRTDEIKCIAHKLHLSSTNIGAMKVAELAKQLETQTNDGQISHIPKLLMKLLANFDRVNEKLAKPKVTDLFQ